MLTVLTVFSYASPDIAPSEFWLSAFLPYGIPFLAILQAVVALYLLFRKKWWLSIIPLALTLYGCSFAPRIFSFHLWHSSPQSNQPFSVLSYNVRVFNVYDIYHKNDPNITENLIRDAIDSKGDIKCFQEFYSEKKSTKFNTVKRLLKKYPYYYFEPFLVNRTGGFGMAIFSKYPIENKGSIQFKEKSNNQIVYADIVIGRNKVRIFNVHLQSMNINEDELADSRSQNRFKQNLLKALLRYKLGAIRRSKQIDKLVMEINRSPYPVIVCGDFNEPPLGYAYKQILRLLSNSQESAGTGIGATHNGRIPFLRIDNQFYQDDLTIHSFEVLKQKKLSDHFPLLGTYSFK